MDNLSEVRFKQLDQVTLITTRNVSYLSAKPGTELSPHGIWSVAGSVAGSDLILVKNGIVIRIPASDVLKSKENDLDEILKSLERMLYD